MLLKSKTGIQCDNCGAVNERQFTYYSYDVQEIPVQNNKPAPINYKADPIFSLDICEKCHKNYCELVVKNYKPTRCTPSGEYTKGIYCEFTGQRMIGNYKAYLVVVTQIKVNMRDPVCLKCGKKSTGQQCQCGSIGFNVQADTIIEERNLELWLHQSAYKSLTEKVNKTRQSKPEWSASNA